MCVLSSGNPLAVAPALRPARHVQRLALAVTRDDAIDPLVLRAQRGEPAALQALFVRHRNDVARMVTRVLGPDADLDDVVQEVFIQVFRSIGTFQGSARFSTWLYRVASNVARMHIRKQQVRPRLQRVDAGVEPSEGRDSSPHPDAELQRQRRLRALDVLLQQLSDKKRLVFVLHDLQGLSAAEIAEVVEAPVLTVRTRLFYARKELYAAIRLAPELAELFGEEGLG
jgi:RNA polymerase sigma-70 factor (ECF subfamily)